MNASCALQHFCDLHGPQILLCTESKTYVRDMNDPENENLKILYSQYIKSENSHSKTQCKSCVLSSDGLLISTVDALNHMLFISSSSTPNQELFKNTRNACVRSLNIERSAESDHPVLFGDDENGYCLSIVFSCKDFHARGSQRLYSLCYLTNDKYHLLSLMTSISSCMREIIHWLQFDANHTYEQEGHIRVNTNFQGTATKATYVLRPPPRTPSQRMLTDIVQDPKLIYRIHGLFVWLLRTANSIVNESLFDALPTEEQSTQQERKELFQHEVPRNRTRTIIDTSSIGLESSTLTSDPYLLSKSFHSMHHTSEHNSDEDDDDYASLQYQFSSYGHIGLGLFRKFFLLLNNEEYFKYILHQWVIGNQLVIKYTNFVGDQDLIRAFVSVLRLLLPDGCCHIIEGHQVKSYTANLILLDTEKISSIDSENEETTVIRMIFDNIDDFLRVVRLETLPSPEWNQRTPMYIENIFNILTDSSIDEEAFEATVVHFKMKYLNKAKVYFQLGRCQNSSSSTLSERQQMDLFHVKHESDLRLIRFWKEGLSTSYKSQIRALKQDDNQQKQNLNKL